MLATIAAINNYHEDAGITEVSLDKPIILDVR